MHENNKTGLDRRELIKGAIALVGGGGLLAACSDAEIDALDPATAGGRFLDDGRMALLARIVDVVMPATDTPGALEAGVHRFVDGMLADWASAETRQRYVATLDEIDARARAEYARDLIDCTATEQEALLRKLDESAFSTDPDVPGFRELRFLILSGYYTSEIGASVELRFELVPGRYLECVPVDEIGRAWAYR